MARKKSSFHTFDSQLRATLEHFNDPIWLATHSPLATPYFLGHRLADSYVTDEVRGRALQRLLEEAIHHLWGDGERPTTQDALMKACREGYNERGSKSSRYRYTLLELRYVRRLFPQGDYPHDTGDCQVILGVGNNPFFEHLKKTIAQLGEIILSIVQPTSPLERPLLNTTLIGRQDTFKQTLHALKQGQTAAISGRGGIGKTTLGRTIRQAWVQKVAFWYTFRPQLNDRLDAVLFHIGQFFQQALPSGSVLWQHLLVNEGKIDADQKWLGLLTADLSQIKPDQPLFCFDEIDVLRPAYLDQTQSHHQAIHFFLEELRGQTPLLLIGQRIPLNADQHITLDNFSLDEVRTFAASKDVSLSDEQIDHLHQFSHGNPRLIELLLTLHLNGDRITDFLIDSAELPAIQPYLDRLWRRMKPDEQKMLTTLSVFRTAIPKDAPLLNTNAIEQLSKRHLLDKDEQGGVTIPLFIRQMTYNTISQKQRDDAHRLAAELRSILGEYSAAAFHYSQAGEYEAAIEIWHPHLNLEIKRGHAAWAQTTFSTIPANQLSTRYNKQLTLIRNHLYMLSGEARRILDETDNTLLANDDEDSIEIRTQRANAARIVGRTDNALQEYQNALDSLARLIGKTVHIYTLTTNLHVRHRDMELAQQGVRYAQYHTTYLQGCLSMENHQYDQSHAHFNDALDHAEKLGDGELLAKTHQQMITLSGFMNEPEQAHVHAEKAMAWYDQIGNQYELEGSRARLIIVYLTLQNYTEAIQSAEKSLTYYEKIGEVRVVCGMLSNLTEAYYHTDQLDKTIKTALRIQQMEEPYYTAYALNFLGLAYHKQSRTEYAIVALEHGIALANQAQDQGTLAMLEQSLAHVRTTSSSTG